MPVRTVLCTPANINDVIAKYVPRDPSAQAAPPPAAVVPTPAAGQAAPQPAAAPAKAVPTGPMTDEEKLQRRNYAIIAAMLTGIVVVNGLIWGVGMRGFLSVSAGLLASAIAGGIAWKMKSR
jgi:hypothetical protein